MTGSTGHHGNSLAGTWIALLALTGASALIAYFPDMTAALVVVLVLAVLKARLIVLDFIGLRHSQRTVVRRALLGWCILLASGAVAKVVVLAVGQA